MYDELDLDQDGLPNNTPIEDIDVDQHASKVKKLRQGFIDDYDIDPSLQHVFSRDFMRVDVGLMIQRPPIFVRMRSNDIDFLTARQKHMEEYSVDTKQFIDEFNEVSRLNEDVLSNNPYASRLNIDNYPTHRM